MLRIGLTIGDPAGIGPEIAVAALRALEPAARARVTVFGDAGPLERAARALGTALPELTLVESGAGQDVAPGAPGPASGRASMAYLEAAIAEARAGRLAAVCTAPISKTWAKSAGLAFPGHTELLAERLGAERVAMMFAGQKLRVVLATTHVPLARVPHELSTDGLTAVIRLFCDALSRDFGLSAPRVGVVGLNPHAGEGGMLGHEDRDLIAPAIARGAGAAQLVGPLVPDAAFRDHVEGRYDALVAMYHDQALIPVKLIDFEDAVNVTLGLPIVRTSPDHGTAFDLAGQGRARARSMQRALALAFELAERRARHGLCAPVR